MTDRSKKVVSDEKRGDSSGFVVSCAKFPADAIDDDRRGGRPDTTDESTSNDVDPHSTSPVVTQLLGYSLSPSRLFGQISPRLTGLHDRVWRRHELSTSLNPLTRLEPDPQSPTWMGLNWSRWFELQDWETLRKELPRRPGLYRVRHSGLPGLMYIGESGAEGGVRQRVGLGLSAGVNESERQTGNKHGAAHPLRQITDVVGGQMEVSVTTPDILKSETSPYDRGDFSGDLSSRGWVDSYGPTEPGAC